MNVRRRLQELVFALNTSLTAPLGCMMPTMRNLRSNSSQKRRGEGLLLGILRTVRGIDAILLISSSGLYQEGRHPKAYHKIKDSKAGEQGSREIENQGLEMECARQHITQFPPDTGTPSLGDYISIYGHGRHEQCHLQKF